MQRNRIIVDGIPIDPLTVEQLHARMDEFVRNNQRALVLHVNVHGMNLAASTPWLRRLYSEAELVFCYGAGVKLGARILGERIPQRITYADWMWDLAAFAGERGYGLYL